MAAFVANMYVVNAVCFFFWRLAYCFNLALLRLTWYPSNYLEQNMPIFYCLFLGFQLGLRIEKLLKKAKI